MFYLLLMLDRFKRFKYKVVFFFILFSILKSNKFYKIKGYFYGCVFYRRVFIGWGRGSEVSNSKVCLLGIRGG